MNCNIFFPLFSQLTSVSIPNRDLDELQYRAYAIDWASDPVSIPNRDLDELQFYIAQKQSGMHHQG